MNAIKVSLFEESDEIYNQEKIHKILNILNRMRIVAPLIHSFNFTDNIFPVLYTIYNGYIYI